MITLFAGLPGEGKTLLMTRKAFKEFKRGRKIYSNYHLNFGEVNKDWFFFHNLEQLNDLTNCLVLIDEGQIMFNCRRWDKLSIQTQYKLQTHRHDGLDLWITSQDISRLDVEVRILIHYHYYMRKIVSLEKYFKVGLFAYDSLDVITGKCLQTRFSFFDFKQPPLYDTSKDMSYLIPVEDVDYFVGYKRCSNCSKDHRVGEADKPTLLKYLKKQSF